MNPKNEGPIPGQSLTATPGAAQYERPPQKNTPEDAFEAYLEKFDDPQNRETLFELLETRMPLDSVVTTLTREAVRNGVHSVDLAVVLRPVVHQYLSVLADAAGVEYIETATQPFEEEELSKREKKFIANKVELQLRGEAAVAERQKKLRPGTMEPPLEAQRAPIVEEPPVEPPVGEPPASSGGLMKRPGVM